MVVTNLQITTTGGTPTTFPFGWTPCQSVAPADEEALYLCLLPRKASDLMYLSKIWAHPYQGHELHQHIHAWRPPRDTTSRLTIPKVEPKPGHKHHEQNTKFPPSSCGCHMSQSRRSVSPKPSHGGWRLYKSACYSCDVRGWNLLPFGILLTIPTTWKDFFPSFDFDWA